MSHPSTESKVSERIGNCEQCGQRFGGIPESITALKVKCAECGGTVSIPPLPEAPIAAAPPVPSVEQASAPTPPPVPTPAEDKPLAAPLGDAKSKGGARPGSAKPVDRDITTVRKPATPPKMAKPIVPLRPVVKVAKPIKPLNLAAKPAKSAVPLKSPAAPVKPIAKPVAVKPIAPKPVAPKPVVTTPPVKKSEPPKPTVAEIIAKAKAKKTAAAKPSAADIIAKAKAKREGAGSPSAAPAIATGGPRKVAVAAAKPKVATRTAGKRPAGGGSARSSTRRRPQEEEYEEKSKAPMFIVGAIVLLGASFGIYALMGNDKKPLVNGQEVVNVPAESNGTPANLSNDNSVNTPPAAAETGSSTSAGSTDTSAGTEDPATSATEDSDPAPKAAPQPKASLEFTLPAAGERINTIGITDPALIVLEQVAPLDKASDTSADTWQEAVEDLALYLEDSGASSNRAGNRLAEDYPRAAFPAIINAMLKVDYTSTDGLHLASSLNNLLLRIGTRDLSWKATDFNEPGTAEWDAKVVFNKKVVAAWHNLWVETYANSLSAWNNFSKVAASGAAVEEADTGGIVGPDDDLFN